MAPISTIFCRNRARRPDLDFEKKIHAVLVVVAVVVAVVVGGVVGVGGMAEPFKLFRKFVCQAVSFKKLEQHQRLIFVGWGRRLL